MRPAYRYMVATAILSVWLLSFMVFAQAQYATPTSPTTATPMFPADINTGSPLMPDGPMGHAAVVTPSDTVDMTHVSRRLYVGGTGTITLITAGGETVLFSAVPVATQLPIQATRVKVTGTTATLIIEMW